MVCKANARGPRQNHQTLINPQCGSANGKAVAQEKGHELPDATPSARARKM
jgi:hypothetical protein